MEGEPLRQTAVTLSQDLDRRLEEVVVERSDHFIGLLTDLLRFQTVRGDEGGPETEGHEQAFQAAFRYLRLTTQRMGLDMRIHDDIALVIDWPGTDPQAPPLGVAAHLDVVPGGDDWRYPPFGGTVVDGEIWGRGAQDDKGPLAAILAAIDALQALGIRPRRTVRLLIGTYEETEDWPDMDLMLEREGPPSQVLVPDGAFPIGVGEKGIANIEWATSWIRRADEPGPLHFVSLDGGTRANVVPGEATIEFEARTPESKDAQDLLESVALRVSRSAHEADVDVSSPMPAEEGMTRFRVSLSGRAAHAAIPHDGHNAALDGLAFLSLMGSALRPEVHRFACFLHDRTSPLDGHGVGLRREHPQMGTTTLNLGRVRIDRAGAHAVMNVRFPVGTSTRDVEAAFHRAALMAVDDNLTIHTQMVGRPQGPFLVDDERFEGFLGPLKTAYETVTGASPDSLTIAGTTYAKLFPMAVGFGPVDMTRGEPVVVHQRNERVQVTRYLENIRIYGLAIALLACDGGT